MTSLPVIGLVGSGYGGIDAGDWIELATQHLPMLDIFTLRWRIVFLRGDRSLTVVPHFVLWLDLRAKLAFITGLFL